MRKKPALFVLSLRRAGSPVTRSSTYEPTDCDLAMTREDIIARILEPMLAQVLDTSDQTGHLKT